ncbi:hypothetical protein WNY59_06725 [Ahrensia kielensis]|uniref:Uncharacterized protein n=1 Tax=Ahrensia kielensis TaxID=76980 RepID=A0ABU9T572_9HYPH
MFVRFVASCLSIAAIATTSLPAHADAKRDSKFLNKIEGSWRGPGEIVAGKYKGTKFTCDLDGSTPDKELGMALKGTCRVGIFSQRMEATVTRKGKTYKGAFLDGALGEGLDVTAGNVTSDRIVLTLKRKDLNGAMLARLANDNKLNVTVSVRVGQDLVPVIGMSLNRIDNMAVGSIK